MAARPKRRIAQLHRVSFSRARHLIGLSLAGVLALVSGQAFAAADDAMGAQLAAACASCHGPDDSDRGIPVIVGLDAQKIVDAVVAYRASETPSHVMHAVALSLSDEELASVAAYLAAHGDAP